MQVYYKLFIMTHVSLSSRPLVEMVEFVTVLLHDVTDSQIFCHVSAWYYAS